MASLHVKSLFTNILLEETIDNIINDFYLTTDQVIIFKRKNLNIFLLLQHMIFFSFLTENTTLKLMVLLWDPLWGQHLLFCVLLRKNGFQNALQNFYRISITKNMLITFL